MTTGSLAPCANCQASMQPFCTATDENRRCSDLHFEYVQCPACGVISLVNPPADLGPYYASDYYAIPSPERMRALASRENAKMAAIKPFKRGGRLLEIGPAFGVFSMRAKSEGFEVDVIERDSRCCEHLQGVVGVNATNSVDPEQCVRQMPRHDVIALWHVIEHLPDPFSFFDAAAENLLPGGLLVMGAPNPEAVQFGIMGRTWPHLDAPRHIHLIPASAFVERGKRHGLELRLLTTDDADAKSWNRFGWQRLLMNRLPGRLGEAIGFSLGAILAVIMWPFERGCMRGSAYTITFKK